MPKNRKPRRKLADTLRVALSPGRGRVAGERIGSLLVVQGAEIDLGQYVVCDEPITIGRDEEADLSLSDGSISRAHCKVERDPDGDYVLVDLGSTNGTSLNGDKVSDRVPLNPGDKIFLGASVVRFAYVDDLDLQFQSRLEEMVNIDPLTGMSTPRQYDASYRTLIERAASGEMSLTVLVMDLDGLKQVNDTYGHEMGGYVIAETAAIIRGVLEDHGYVCRFGGDEFVSSLPGIDKARGLVLAEKVRDRVEWHDFSRHGVVVEPTVSIGVAAYPGDVTDPDQLFAAADRNMYDAKRSGKNRVSGGAPT